MNVSPSPSPRRLQRQRPVSPLAKTQPRTNDDSSVNSIGSSTTHTGHNGAVDQGGFYQVSLSDGPALPPANRPTSNHSSRAPSPLRSFTHSYSQSYSHSSDYEHRERQDRDNNYGYRPTYKDDTSTAATGTSNTASRSSSPLRPVQEYHNAYSHTDEANPAPLGSPLSLPPPPSASGSSSPTSKFATFSSASRAFLEHRRNQSIPNLMPTISSIGRNLGRAISPERSLQSFQTSPRRPPIPDYRDSRSARRESYSGDEDSEDDDSESASSDGSYSDEDDEDSEDISDDEDEDEPRHRRNSMMAPFTGDSRTSRRNNTSTSPSRNDDRQSDTASIASGFSNWLSGGTVKAASPERPSILANSRTTTPEPSIFAARGGPGHSRRSMSLASNASVTPRSNVLATTNSPSRFSQLATTMSATLSRLTQQPPVSPRSAGAGFERDELYHLDLEDALFPAGHPSERDAFSPSAFKNLEVNATGALRRMQIAYRQRSVALRDMTAEKSVRDEEFEEVETRAQHLKMQLEGMARRAADQQREMEILMEELAAEKKARAQERAMLLSGVPTTPSLADSPSRERDYDPATSTAMSEDLDVDDAQRRRSYKSNDSSIDDTDDGDYESGSSMFSRSRSPTIAPSISYSMDNGAGIGSESQYQAHHPRVAALGSMRLSSSRTVSSSSAATVVSQTQQPMSKFQKLVKNVAAAIKDEEPDMLGMGTTSCENCRGQDVSFAWNTVSVLRDENKHLKQRVGQLEVAVEGALDMVNGVGL